MLILSTNITNRTPIDVLDHFSINAQTKLHNNIVLKRPQDSGGLVGEVHAVGEDASSPLHGLVQ